MTTDQGADKFSNVVGLVESLKRGAIRAKKRKNLDLLLHVLRTMWGAKCCDYSLAEVGRRLEVAGGPKTQSLRNYGGKDFRDVIEAFAACAGANEQLSSVEGRSQIDIALETINDPSVRAIFRQIIAQNRLYKTQNDDLRSAFKLLSIRRPADDSPPSELVAIPPLESLQLTMGEKSLLKRNLSRDRFAENGWSIRDDGAVEDQGGVVILTPGFMGLMNKITA